MPCTFWGRIHNGERHKFSGTVLEFGMQVSVVEGLYVGSVRLASDELKCRIPELDGNGCISPVFMSRNLSTQSPGHMTKGHAGRE